MPVRVVPTWLTTTGTITALSETPTSVISNAIGIDPASPDTRGVQGLEGVFLQYILFQVFRHERADIIAAESQCHLDQVVGAEAEEVCMLGDLVCSQGGAWDLVQHLFGFVV